MEKLGINSKGMESHNKSVFLFHLFARHRASLSEIASQMGLSITAVSRIASALVAQGVIAMGHEYKLRSALMAVKNAFAELFIAYDALEEPNEKKMRGQSAGICSFSNEELLTICMEVRPNSIHSVIADFFGNAVTKEYISPCDLSNKEALLKSIEQTAKFYMEALKGSKLRIALALHGQVDNINGVSIMMPQAAFHESVQVKYELEKRLGLSVMVDNDCVMRTLAQKWSIIHLQQELKDFCIINLDYGIGSSFLINEDIYRGTLFGSGQIGHTIVNLNGAHCSCGRYGCLEAEASMRALVYNISRDKPQIKLEDAAFSEIVKLYQEHDDVVRHHVDRCAKLVGIAIYNFLNVININKIYLYGALCSFGQDFLDNIAREVFSNPFDREQQVKEISTSIEFGDLSRESQIAGIALSYIQNGQY